MKVDPAVCVSHSFVLLRTKRPKRLPKDTLGWSTAAPVGVFAVGEGVWMSTSLASRRHSLLTGEAKEVAGNVCISHHLLMSFDNCQTAFSTF